MELRKISIDDRDVLRKRRTNTNCSVGYYVEEFDCGGNVSHVTYGKMKSKRNMGISKMENNVSSKKYLVHSWSGEVNGA